ncbi:glycosyl hydrolase 115 family protein [Sphingomonas echinoides]|uniref:Glycosyl hydrolase 115 family protein n=1 Tax=Sphingomonas echinoides TaxID=59803 RepID=A0ABU4PHM8_9SPHN|nr:glycosyl hydrolase 115 family protein [Sphingomonas echinoides]MDX5983551.1 glycosyl hydrolase 115 family protein [Sphingomonas echinoides]
MLTRRGVVGGALAGSLLGSPLAAALQTDRRRPGFDIASPGDAITPIFVDAADLPGVRRAAADLAADIGRVTGTDARIVHDPRALPDRVILVGALGTSPLIDHLVAAGKVAVHDIRGKWEAFLIQTVANPMPGVKEALVIVGSDKRGTIYGVYDVSRMIGVSPWYWWADVPVVRQSRLRIANGRYVQDSPAVKYRGIFLNDEAPCLSGWTAKTFGGMNAAFYGRLFELLLRLRANYLWPAMWNNAFAVDDPANAPLAEDYGIVMGTSHHEPMMKAHKEWTDHRQHYGNGEWNYATNAPAIRDFFREGIDRNAHNEVIVTVGMRGDGDVALESSGSLQSDVTLLEGVITDQRRIIAEGMGRPAEQVPQVWVLFTEVYKYYDAGLELPDDVTIMFADDNVGNLRRLPLPSERGRSGGFGIYFHMDMHGGPFSYQWINSNPLPKIWEQMNLAHRYGANEIWIANVGDLKPLELPIEFFLAMAWRPSDVGKDKIAGWTHAWAERQFGPEHAAEIAMLAARYAKYNAWRKPEQLKPDSYSLENYREAERVCDAWRELERRADAVNETLRSDQRDAFYQLVLYPVRACSNLTQMYVAAARNARFAEQGRASTSAEADEVRRRFHRDHDLRDYYNHTMAGGKWDHMMDQTHIGYFDWYPPGTDIMPPVAEIDLDPANGFGVAVDGSARSWPGYYLPPELPILDSLTREKTFIEVFPRGAGPAPVTVTADQPWVVIEEGKAFGVSTRDRRFWVDIDWNAVKTGRSEATITVEGHQTVTVRLTALRASAQQEREARGASGGLTGAFSLAAARFDRSVAARGVRCEPIPDYGQGDAAMSVFPVDAEPFTDTANAPRLEYDVFLGESGPYHIDLVTAPTLEVYPGRHLAVAVGFDDAAPVAQAVFTPTTRAAQDFLGEQHAANTAANARTMRFTLPVDAPGRHVLKVFMQDPTIVVQKIIVHKSALARSYFGPPAWASGGRAGS